MQTTGTPVKSKNQKAYESVLKELTTGNDMEQLPFIQGITTFVSPTPETDGTTELFTKNEPTDILKIAEETHKTQVEIFLQQPIGMEEGSVQKQLSNMRKRTGMTHIECKLWSDGANLLKILQENPPREGVKRMILTCKKLQQGEETGVLGKLVEDHSDLFKWTRTYNLDLPTNYDTMSPHDRAFYQGQDIMEAAYASLYEKGNTIIGAILGGLWKGRITGADSAIGFLDGICEKADETEIETKDRIKRSEKRSVSFIDAIGADFEHIKLIMKTFWIAA